MSCLRFWGLLLEQNASCHVSLDFCDWGMMDAVASVWVLEVYTAMNMLTLITSSCLPL